MFCLFTFACSLQLFLLLVIILAFFLLTTSISPHVQLGLYNKYLKQHRAVFALSLLTVLLVGSIGAFRLVSTEQRWFGEPPRHHASGQLHLQDSTD